MNPVEVTLSNSPIVLGLPHTGTHVPEDMWAQLNERGRELRDTDWHVDRLYDGLLADVTSVRATFHRYVIDANRGPDNASLYPGQNTTGLVPVTDFDGNQIWKTDPSADEIEKRRQLFHAPYHAALEAEMQRVAGLHGIAILFDCHSIRSRIPFLFEGVLPDFNIGTNNGQTCASEISDVTSNICANSEGYSMILNGRFKGGWTTRHYGRPAQHWHAIQMELAQSTYLSVETAPWTFDEMKAANLRPVLKSILRTLTEIAPSLRTKP